MKKKPKIRFYDLIPFKLQNICTWHAIIQHNLYFKTWRTTMRGQTDISSSRSSNNYFDNSIAGGGGIWTLDVSFGKHQEVPTSWITRLLAAAVIIITIINNWNSKDTNLPDTTAYIMHTQNTCIKRKHSYTHLYINIHKSN